MSSERPQPIGPLRSGTQVGPYRIEGTLGDFAPRLKKPVLMVNGRYDATFPYESAQLPLFRMLGTPPAEKRHAVLDTPHDVTLRRADLVREVLAWYDKYLGAVN